MRAWVRGVGAVLASLSLAACAATGGAPTGAAAPDPANSFLVQDVRLFDGERVTERTRVLVRDGRVAAVGAGLRAPAGVEVVEGAGKTLIPGLIDSHVHVFPGAQADALRFGVTTEIDMFSVSGPSGLQAFRAQRESLARTIQADTWSAGIGVTPPGGHPAPMAKAMGVDMPTLAPGADADAFVAARIAEGSDHIKVFQQARVGTRELAAFPQQTLSAVVASGKRRGKRVVVHVADEASAIQAMTAGADGLAHMFDDAAAGDRFLSLARARGAFIIPTLSVLVGQGGPAESAALAADPAIKPWLSGAQTGMLAARFKTLHPEVLPRIFESTRRAHAAGLTILAGSDAPNPGTAHGPALHMELALLVRAGLSPVEALQAATSAPADVFRLGDRGRIRAGSRADLVLVDGDPTREITATRRISRIWKNGYTVDRTPAPDPRGPPPAGS